MTVLIWGVDVGDNPPYWWDWRVTGLGRASGFVDPAYRADFFAELRMAAPTAPRLRLGPSALRSSTYVLDTATGRGWSGDGPSGPVWGYFGDNPAMTLYVCCAAALTVPVGPSVEAIANGITPGGVVDLLLQVAAADPSPAIYVEVASWWIASSDADNVTATWHPGWVNSTETGPSHPLTKVAEVGAGTNQRVMIFRLLAPPASSSAGSRVRYNVTGNSFGAGYGYRYLHNVAQASPERATGSGAGTGSVTSAPVAAQSGDLVLDCANFYSGSSGGTIVDAGAQVEDWTSKFGSTFRLQRAGAGHGSAAPVWQFDSSAPWKALSVAVKGA